MVMIGAVAGAAMYWLQSYAFYTPAQFIPGAEIMLTPLSSGVPEPILVENLQGIDSASVPLKFRACFTTTLTLGMLSETYIAYKDAQPLTAPGWFDCFDANEIGEALDEGRALAFLSQSQIAPQIDRVVAVFPDGRAYAWHQIVPEAARDYSGTPAPKPSPDATPDPAPKSE
jgi:hypothetical protein